MSKRKRISPYEKVNAVKEYLEGNHSWQSIADKYQVSASSFRKWLYKYQASGEASFLKVSHNSSYSEEFKLSVIMDYLNGKGSYSELTVKYKIPSSEMIRRWVLRYNGHSECKTSLSGGKNRMAKGRRTTFDERVEIVQYCIARSYNYAETAEKYQVSYQQARSYTVKYESGGVDALKDRRGKHKAPEEMNELEKLRAEVKILKAEKEHAEMEASFLKKLEEIERRRD